MRSNGETNNNLNKLASRLVVNHLRIDLKGENWQGVLKEKTEMPEPCRTIAVIGAGASMAAGLPSASDAIERLRNELDIIQAEYQQEIDRLNLVHGFSQAEFETALLAFSNIIYPPEKVRDAVKELFNIRYRPLLVYEVLAHLLKHRFLDAIINFNFDELLDQSISDELDPQEYYYIVHDGDCPDSTGDPEHPYDLPVYLKPHGTASHRSSLRFTREAYYGIPREIIRVLKDFLSGTPVTLLVIGFSMQSPELNKLIARSRLPVNIFYVNPNEPDEEGFKEKFEPKNDIFWHHIPVHKEVDKSDRNRTSPGKVMQNLCESISGLFRKEYYTPRGIQRHKLICQIFEDLRISSSDPQFNPAVIRNYLRDRTIVELVLSVAKAKGLINMSVISHDRAGKYYDLYCEDNTDKFTRLYEFCEILELEEISYAREAFRLVCKDEKPKQGNQNERKSADEFGIVDEREFKECIDELFQIVKRRISPQNQSSMERYKNEFRETLLYLYRDKEIELRGQVDPFYKKTFHSPQPIRTLTGLSFETEQLLLRKHKWNRLFIIAETGEWLIKDRIVEIINNGNIKIWMVVADESYKSRLEDAFGKKIAGFQKINWWDHNRHLTLILDDYIPLGGIYFTRRLRSPFISPVSLAERDALLALEVFIAYWYKGLGKGSWVKREQLDISKFFKMLDNEAHE